VTCDVSTFISHARGLFDAYAKDRLPEVIARRWTADELAAFLCARDRDAVCLAARCLAIVGDWRDCELLTVQLGSPDAVIVASVEEALFAIWARAASPEAIERLHCASCLLDAGEFGATVAALRRLTADFPKYAEAHHQMAIAHHALEQCDSAERHYCLTIALNPYHYPAHAALGHLAVQRDLYAEAASHYKRALEIHPRLIEVREILPGLEGALASRVVA
jgi:tetratricopeptide (TPR) repeat protein